MKEKVEELREKLTEVGALILELNKGGVTINFEITNYKKTIEMDAIPYASHPFTVEIKKTTITTEL